MRESVTCYQRWQCDRCRASGTVEFLSHEDAATIKESAVEQHAIAQPECAGALRLASTAIAAGR